MGEGEEEAGLVEGGFPRWGYGGAGGFEGAGGGEGVVDYRGCEDVAVGGCGVNVLGRVRGVFTEDRWCGMVCDFWRGGGM